MSYQTQTATDAHVVVNGTAFAQCRAVYVGVTGDVVATIAGTNFTFKNAVQGSVLPIQTTVIIASGTTATNLIALY